MFASSGDDGAAQPSCDGSSFIKSASLPAADPLVTGVGATSLTASQPDGAYQSETAWNDELRFERRRLQQDLRPPGYQNGFVHSAGRGVPDISYSGDVNNGLLIAWSQGDPANVGDIFLFGGTSAGLPAVGRDHRARRPGRPPPARLPERRPLLARARRALQLRLPRRHHRQQHRLARLTPSGNPVNITGYPATKGWDAVTGLGTPDVAHLLQYLR